MDDEGITNKNIIKETTDIINRQFSKKKLETSSYKIEHKRSKPSLKEKEAPRKTVTIEKEIIQLLANEK